MELINGLLLGLAAAAGATLFPGLQNMASVSVSLRAGRRAAYTFGLAMAMVFTAQAALAVFFANYFTSHPSILLAMRQWGALVLFILAIFFLFKGYRIRLAHVEPEDLPYHGAPFPRGIMLALMNLLVIPYFFALGGWLLSYGYLHTDALSRLAFIAGAGAGAMIVFGAYARMAEWINRKAHFLTRNINFLLAGVLMILAIVQGARVYL